MQKSAVKIYVLPGGKMPERKTKGAIGYDVFLQAIVSPDTMDPDNKVLRKVLFDSTERGAGGFGSTGVR